MPNFSLIHQVSQPKRRGKTKPPMIVLLHGIGADEFDLFELAPMFDPRCVVVSARAPLEWATGFAWFNIMLDGAEFRYDLAEIKTARDLITRFVGECLSAYEADPKRVFLVGFSQGAMMAANVGAHHPGLARGVVAMSGAMLPAPELGAPITLNALALHGAADMVVPVARGRDLRDKLTSLGASVTYYECDMGHEITGESFAQVQTWVAERL